MRGIMIWISRWRGRTKVAELAEEIANASIDAVWRLVHARLTEMALAEVRGYVRARSTALVRRQARQLLLVRSIHLSDADQVGLTRLATEGVIRRAIGRYLAEMMDQRPSAARQAA